MRTLAVVILSSFLFLYNCKKNNDDIIPDNSSDSTNNTGEVNLPNSNNGLINDNVYGQQVVIIGNIEKNFIVSFINNIDGSAIKFEPVHGVLPIIMKDPENNYWDITGEVVIGAKKGIKLKTTKSFMGFWFSWGAFFPGVEIYNDDRPRQSSSRPYLDGDWLIPSNEVLNGGQPKDGIPALETPEVVLPSRADYLSGDDLVLGYKNGNTIRAYPHHILDWHEIINDEVDNKNLIITYCPLTGTGIGWQNMEVGNFTFGVSGKLYNTNLIPYDRKTGSNWSQIRLDCVNGSRKREKIEPIQLIETKWATWKSMYPQTKVVSTNTGYSRNYGNYPYGDYRTGDWLLFPISVDDKRLKMKEVVHGIIVNDKAKIYRFIHFAKSK